MSLSKGDIVLFPFPFTDLSQTKLKIIENYNQKRSHLYSQFIMAW